MFKNKYLRNWRFKVKEERNDYKKSIQKKKKNIPGYKKKRRDACLKHLRKLGFKRKKKKSNFITIFTKIEIQEKKKC